jgi:hypothetical protein
MAHAEPRRERPDPLARPLEESWRPVLDAVLRRLGAPLLDETAKLAPRVATLSRAYNEGRAGDSKDRGALPLEARVAFSFARDVPKGAGAVAELVAARLLEPPSEGRPLRVLDLGAGLGAMTWGLARALAAAGRAGRIEALLVDEDEAALGVAARLHEAARSEGLGTLGLGGIDLALRTRTARLGQGFVPSSFAGEAAPDVILLGQVVSELDTTLDAPARVVRHADLVRLLLAELAPGGSLVVVEPALRNRSRHLHAVRDALVTGPSAPVLFAPCLHTQACPALASEGDWCHEDRAVDLPTWLVPLARAAGLRFQGLTFSYLVLRRDGPTLRALVQRSRDQAPEGADRLVSEIAAPGAPHRLVLRVVSDAMPSKGKVEVFVCTEKGERLRVRRLDRDVTDETAAWSDLGRGDVVSLATSPEELPIDERGRLARVTVVDVHPTRR